MISSYISIASVLPLCLMATNTSTYGFASVEDHIRSILANPGVATSTHQKYIAYCYGTLAKLTLNHAYTGLLLNRRLTVCIEGLGIQLWSKQDLSLGDLIDSRIMAKTYFLRKIIIL